MVYNENVHNHGNFMLISAIVPCAALSVQAVLQKADNPIVYFSEPDEACLFRAAWTFFTGSFAQRVAEN